MHFATATTRSRIRIQNANSLYQPTNILGALALRRRLEILRLSRGDRTQGPTDRQLLGTQGHPKARSLVQGPIFFSSNFTKFNFLWFYILFSSERVHRYLPYTFGKQALPRRVNTLDTPEPRDAFVFGFFFLYCTRLMIYYRAGTVGE